MTIITHRRYLAVALPFVLSTVTQPLLGAVDTAVVGRLDDAACLGGVAIGTTIFNTLYWLFGFLRVSTSGYSAQSLGTGNPRQICHAYCRPLVMALLIGLGFALLQQPIIRAALAVYQPASAVADHAETYFRILIWGAPLVLVNYVNLGWLMGQKRIKATLFLPVSANGMNIIIDVVFVFLLEMGVAGVAWATLIAQAYGFLAGLGLIQVHLGAAGIRTHWPGVMDPVAMRRMIMVNGDLLVRTFCLLTMTNLFVAKGSELGSVFLAANAVLFQVQYIVAYFFDGLANASSVFAGDALGLEDFKYFRRTRAITDVYLLGLILLATIVLAMFKGPITHCFTNLEAVVTLCHEYMIWLILYPLAIGPGLVYFGFYTGTTHTIPVRNSMLVALAVFLATYYLMVPLFDNHGLWLAFILFSLCRSTVLVMGMKGMEQQLFGLKRRHPVVPAV